MNVKKILFSVLLAAGCLSASAQEPKTVETFNHHWFLQAQGGGQYTLGEVKFNKLLSPNVQVAAGYQFTPVWGLRLAVDGWQSKAGSTLSTGKYYWKWNFIAPTLDVSCDLTNWIGGYKKRLVSVGLLAGLGANIGFNNDEAVDVNNQMRLSHGFAITDDVAYLSLLWDDDVRARFMGRVGAYLDFHICPRVDLGIEVTANTLSDSYNSKKAENTDWYINGLAGLRINLGKLTKRVPVEEPCGEVIVEKVVEKIVEKPVEKIVYRDREPEKREAIRRDIFFPIRGSLVSEEEMRKVDDIVAYMQKYPESKVTITAHADKGTGNAKLNQMYSERRAKITHDLLVKKGIDSSRIVTIAKGDTEQPYAENDKNRVSICIAE